MRLAKLVKPALFRTITIGIGTTALGLCGGRERMGLFPNSMSKQKFIAQVTVT